MNKNFYTVRGYEIKNNSKITPVMEDYIEMIYRNKNEKFMRISQLAKLLNVKDSSASKIIQKLGALKLLNYEKYEVFTLTNKGKKLGSFLLERHKTIEAFLKLIGAHNILKQTELIEHNLDKDTVEKIDILISFFKDNKDIKKEFIIYKDNKFL